jgi:hypothetical protein
LCMIVDAPWYVPNTHPKGFPHLNSQRRNPPLQLSLRCSSQ